MSKNRELFEVFQPSGARKGKSRAPALAEPRPATGPIAGSESVAEAMPIRIPVQAPEDLDAVPGEAHAGPVFAAVQPTAGSAPIGSVGSYDPAQAARSRLVLGRGARRRTITLKFEEAAVYGVGTVLVVALAFLLGRYTSNEAEASGPAVGSEPPVSVARPSEAHSRPPLGAVNVTRRSTGQATSPTGSAGGPRPAAPKSYTIRVETYKHDRDGFNTARAWRKRMSAAGIADVEVLQDSAKKYYYLHAGRFAGRSDPAIRRVMDKIRVVSKGKLRHMAPRRLPKILRPAR